MCIDRELLGARIEESFRRWTPPSPAVVGQILAEAGVGAGELRRSVLAAVGKVA